MFIILFTYKKSLEVIDKYIPEHIAFLKDGYKHNYFIASGRKHPRSGAVILCKLKNRIQLEELIKHHPFVVHGVADYEIIEFIPCDYQQGFEHFIE